MAGALGRFGLRIGTGGEGERGGGPGGREMAFLFVVGPWRPKVGGLGKRYSSKSESTALIWPSETTVGRLGRKETLFFGGKVKGRGFQGSWNF